jgi:hypothetical protein
MPENVLPESQFESLLDAHSAAWLSGPAASDDFARQFATQLTALSVEEQKLLALTERLGGAFLPVEPNPAYLAQLKRDLVGETPAAPALPVPAWLSRWRKLPAPFQIAAGVGGITLTAGLTIFAMSRVLAGNRAEA